MLKLILCNLFFIVGGILYCCLRVSTQYDKEIDDIEQEKFVKNWK